MKTPRIITLTICLIVISITSFAEIGKSASVLIIADKPARPKFVQSVIDKFESNIHYNNRYGWARLFGCGTGTYCLNDTTETQFEWVAYSNIGGCLTLVLSLDLSLEEQMKIFKEISEIDRRWVIMPRDEGPTIYTTAEWTKKFCDEKYHGVQSGNVPLKACDNKAALEKYVETITNLSFIGKMEIVEYLE